MSSGESYQDGRRKGFKDGYEQGKFDARMDLMVKWKREDYDNMDKEQLIQLLVLKDDYIEELKKPPTEQEVCEALSEWFKNKEIKYENGDFYYQPMITKPKQYISIKRKLAFSEKIVYTIETQLPPHLITLIGRFYEGKVKE